MNNSSSVTVSIITAFRHEKESIGVESNDTSVIPKRNFV